jgi:hypothetical protein
LGDFQKSIWSPLSKILGSNHLPVIGDENGLAPTGDHFMNLNFSDKTLFGQI